ncbi:hypothetical protein KAFR_0D00290 [Kazachstania africana CBS 2517]|uniref:Mitochondrial inner membrane i-AAA protease complex subunit MGR1 n=1 Tax=Kazachstania africana (strain ATCC 22294 / BCRC 22015 / CBS 2517 / CECT 1963 / NBRC 1671 / NRRL Y-8276) TaxID=1071382 RepID=H2ATH6_KAZAF|nr:hypothetical protein KAFR_0D00290 [Kazachstania africana CBS 2517]CCF57676.1 hypothetical protein KAFR_0D00290 [Kazachstania africana CBS 2517]
MAVYTPSGNNNNSGINDNDVGSASEMEKFFVRPSLGLKLWGPLVPASDNRTGLWTLLTIQTVVGIGCFKRFNSLRRAHQVIKTNISRLPTLNRFSKTDKIISIESKPLQKLSRWDTTKKFIYLFSGTVILSQSLLELCRLSLLKYDPWYEEARCARDKKFFNDIIKYYNEGIDPTKIQVKVKRSGGDDSVSVNPNVNEIKQSVAIVRAQNEASNPIIKWYGPIELEPMSFNDYLGRMEYYLHMMELLQSRKIRNNDDNNSTNMLLNIISYSNDEIEKVIEKNKQTRDVIMSDLSKEISLQQDNSNDAEEEPGLRQDITKSISSMMEQKRKQKVEHSSNLLVPPRNVILDPIQVKTSEDIDLNEIWSLYDPWMNLGLDTSLSIKFIPTVITPNDAQSTEDQSHSRDDEE